MVVYFILSLKYLVLLTYVPPSPSPSIPTSTYENKKHPPPEIQTDANDSIISSQATQLMQKNFLVRVSAHLHRSPALASVFVVIESEKGIELEMMLGARQ
jgi:hypothetical protein